MFRRDVRLAALRGATPAGLPSAAHGRLPGALSRGPRFTSDRQRRSRGPTVPQRLFIHHKKFPEFSVCLTKQMGVKWLWVQIAEACCVATGLERGMSRRAPEETGCRFHSGIRTNTRSVRRRVSAATSSTKTARPSARSACPYRAACRLPPHTAQAAVRR